MTTISHPYQKLPVLPQFIAALVSGATLFLGILLAWTLGYQLVYAGRIFPGVSVAGIDLSGLTRDEAAVKLSQTLSYPLTGKILFRDGEKVWVASPAELGMVFDPSSSASTAYQLGLSGGLFDALSGQVRARGAGANVVASPGQVGRELKIDATLIYLGAQLQTFADGEVSLVIQEIAPQILDVSAQAETARQVLSQPLTLTIPSATDTDPGPYVYDTPVLAGLLGVQRVQNGNQTEVRVVLNTDGLRSLLAPVKTDVDRPASNAKFTFNDETKQLDLMEESKTGRVMDLDASITAINDALLRGEHSISLVIVEDQPQIPGTATGQELGITELIASQTSYFYGSSPARIQNIQTAAARFHGVMVAPGATFSMGEAMGDVSLDNGFAEALIIYGGRTIKGVGGGVCQVSTTLFRTVFNAGFPVVERNPHAYRVSYYEQTASGAIDQDLAGLDATVYFPLVDFKFKNDSPYWILMETYATNSSLTWKFYSTSDGRSVTWDTTGPINVIPAPPPLFELNEELAKNQMEQVDYAANGADVTVTRTVYQNGAVLFQDQYFTQYQPWQAICQYGPDSRNPEKLAAEKNLCRTPSS